MIRVAYSPVPAELDGTESLGGRETAEATVFYAANDAGSFGGFRAYKSKAVVSALNLLFSFKCAYCESRYGATQPVDVDHYRPKAGIEVDGKLVKPGYYWLAAQWTNLLPSCIDCNRARTHDFPDAEPAVRGKANRFPIGNPAERARQPGEEDREVRHLLHPGIDEPEDHLQFVDDGVVRAAGSASQVSKMGCASIDVYALNRRELVEARRDRLIRIQGAIKRVDVTLHRMMASSQQPLRAQQLADDLRESLVELKSYQDSDQPYAAMARQAIEAYFSSF